MNKPYVKFVVSAPDADPRQAPRQRTQKIDRIVFVDGNGSVDCVIQNMSDTGAKVLDKGDKDGETAWLRILRAIDELLDTDAKTRFIRSGTAEAQRSRTA